MRSFISVIVLLVVLGCQQHKAVPFEDMWPADDSRFAAQERKIVAAARSYLEQKNGRSFDARYKVERAGDDYEVFAMFVGGYEDGRPLFYPGGHCIVVLRQDGSIVRYMPGE